ncbi:MAG: hypothetical protein KJ941_12865 [Bacteroidetes bacterium]|nr:hypothetical protein [Bacteroidota bacterium]
MIVKGKFLALGLSVSMLFLLFSCNQAPEKFCECLEASELVNINSNKVLSGNLDENSKRNLIEARKSQKTKCKDFQETKGEKMREWKKACAANKK